MIYRSVLDLTALHPMTMIDSDNNDLLLPDSWFLALPITPRLRSNLVLVTTIMILYGFYLSQYYSMFGIVTLLVEGR